MGKGKGVIGMQLVERKLMDKPTLHALIVGCLTRFNQTMGYDAVRLIYFFVLCYRI